MVLPTFNIGMTTQTPLKAAVKYISL